MRHFNYARWMRVRAETDSMRFWAMLDWIERGGYSHLVYGKGA